MRSARRISAPNIFLLTGDAGKILYILISVKTKCETAVWMKGSREMSRPWRAPSSNFILQQLMVWPCMAWFQRKRQVFGCRQASRVWRSAVNAQYILGLLSLPRKLSSRTGSPVAVTASVNSKVNKDFGSEQNTGEVESPSVQAEYVARIMSPACLDFLNFFCQWLNWSLPVSYKPPLM